MTKRFAYRCMPSLSDFLPALRQLWDTVNPFEDPYSVPFEDLMNGCDSIATCLLDNGLALDALPVLSLYEYLASRLARSVDDTVHCRQLRVDACTQLGLMAEAQRIIVSLMVGSNLPDFNSAGAAPNLQPHLPSATPQHTSGRFAC